MKKLLKYSHNQCYFIIMVFHTTVVMIVLSSQRAEFIQEESIVPLDVLSLDKNKHPCIRYAKFPLLHNIMPSVIIRIWILSFDELLFHKAYDMVFYGYILILAMKLFLIFIWHVLCLIHILIT